MIVGSIFNFVQAQYKLNNIKGGLSLGNTKFIFHNRNTTEETYEKIVHILIENILNKISNKELEREVS